MAFENKDLSLIAYANGFTLWHYRSDEPLEKITADGYFDSMYYLANTGDIMFINGSDGTICRVLTVNEHAVKLSPIK